jgi:hypothetical protein
MRIFLGRLPFPAQNWHFLQPNAGCRCSQGAEDSSRTSSRWGGTNMPWGGRMKNVSHRVGHPLDLPVFTDSYRSELATHYEIYKAWHDDLAFSPLSDVSDHHSLSRTVLDTESAHIHIEELSTECSAHQCMSCWLYFLWPRSFFLD